MRHPNLCRLGTLHWGVKVRVYGKRMIGNYGIRRKITVKEII